LRETQSSCIAATRNLFSIHNVIRMIENKIKIRVKHEAQTDRKYIKYVAYKT